jgi:CubicO group peptidase (beta-lactamase class C family)
MAENSDALIGLLAELPLIQQPGDSYYYGTNTTVLGVLAERASGRSLKQLVEERVTNPLRIDGLQYGLPAGVKLLPRFSGKDGALREAHAGELNIFGPDVPDYEPDHKLYLGGEGMLATADGYADFLRMLLRRGTLNDHRFLEASTVEEIASPHTQLDSEYGFNGYNLWVNSGKVANGEPGEGGLWIGGGYEGTHFWIDPKRDFVGVIMSQIFWVPELGWGRDEAIRRAIYGQLQLTSD